MFVDEVNLKVIAGKGGDGCTSFHHEKCMPNLGPDGANGGRGANIIFEVDKGLRTLVDLRYNKIIKGDKGENGKGSSRTGANAEDIILKVPEGTTIIDLDTNLVMADLIKDKEQFIVAHGGRGGRGNKAFATHDNPTPRTSELGEPGEIKHIKCELKVLADVGLVGLPSVGKSTFLSVISSSKPKIAAYHFTTLSPNLGVVKLPSGQSFVMADLPGLIEGASNGLGLGLKFLKHAMRTKVIAHVIDMGSFEGRDPINDYEIINKEIANYSEKLANKPMVVIANKMDLPDAISNLNRFKEKYPDIEVLEISAATNQGIDKCLNRLAEIVLTTDNMPLYEEKDYQNHVVYKFENKKPFTIKKDGDVWVVSGEEIDRLFKMTKFTEEESVLRFSRKLQGMGVEDELIRLGAKKGDDIQIDDYIFQFKE